MKFSRSPLFRPPINNVKTPSLTPSPLPPFIVERAQKINRGGSVYASVTAMALSVESLLLVPVGAKIDSLEGMMSRKQTFQEKAALVLGILLLIALFVAIK